MTANHNNVNQITSRTGGGGGGSTVAVEGTVSKLAKIAISQPALGQTTLPASSVRAAGSAYAFSGTSAVNTGANTINVTALDGNNYSATAMVQVNVTNPGPGATTYDLAGNLTSDGVRSYTWDAANRLVKITYAGTGNSTAFAYDGMSRRVREVEVEGGVVVKTRRLVWDGSAIAEERLSDNSVRRAFYSQGVRCVEPGGAAINQLYGRDHLGSVRQLTTTAGAALARYDYDLWGRRTTRTAAAANAEPKSGVLFHESANGTAGAYHQHFFVGATQPLPLTSGDKLTTWVYLDPANPPTEVMLQFADNSWEHRAYWGANQLPWGADNTAARRYMGPLPATGGWVKLEVPISSVGLTGPNITGMAFTLVGGKANWDRTGKTSYLGTETVWFEDKLPAGAIPAVEGGDSWSWTEGQAAPQGFTGHSYHVRSGLHLAPYRAYSAELGMWLNRDPSGEVAGEGLYTYGGNGPNNRIDPDGRFWNNLAGAALGAASSFVLDFSSQQSSGQPYNGAQAIRNMAIGAGLGLMSGGIDVMGKLGLSGGPMASGLANIAMNAELGAMGAAALLALINPPPDQNGQNQNGQNQNGQNQNGQNESGNSGADACCDQRPSVCRCLKKLKANYPDWFTPEWVTHPCHGA